VVTSARSHKDQTATPRPGLRERKRARTFSEIQREALRLFVAQGYEQTTIEQIAEAAEISPQPDLPLLPHQGRHGPDRRVRRLDASGASGRADG
jgi:hypothetical protein